MNHADVRNPFCTETQILNVFNDLQIAAQTLFKWFKNNRMKANHDKYHFVLNNVKEGGSETIANSKCEKLIGNMKNWCELTL